MENDGELAVIPGNNGDNSMEETSARERMNSWRKENAAIASLKPSELTLLKQMITAPEEWRKQQVFLICEFMDEEEALDHVAAYQEAADLGMDCGFNVAYMFALAASCRKINKSSRVSMLLDSLSHFRYTANTNEKPQKGGGSEKSAMNG